MADTGKMRGALKGRRRWTEPELAILRSTYPKGRAAVIKALPHRDVATITAKASILGLTKPYRRWTDEELSRLKAMWGLEAGASICRALNRTGQGVYLKAMQLGLRAVKPEGFETITDCADRMGYSHRSLMGILAWAGVKMVRHVFRPRRKKANKDRSHAVFRRLVDTMEAEDAVIAWTNTETLAGAARRLNVTPTRLRRMMRIAPVKIGRSSSGGTKSQHRAPPEVWDKVLATYTAWRDQRVGIVDAARQTGVSLRTMQTWLAKHGMHHNSCARDLLLKADVDRVVAVEKARMDARHKKAA